MIAVASTSIIYYTSLRGDDPLAGNPNLKNRHAFSNAIDKALFEAFEQLHRDTRVPKSKLLDEAVELLLRKYGRDVPERSRE